MERIILGKCSLCGGTVSIPKNWYGVFAPVARCDKCGAVADKAGSLPTIPMKREDKFYGIDMPQHTEWVDCYY